MPVHPGAAGFEQHRPGGASVDGPVDGAADRGRQRYQDDPGPFADNPQDAVAVFFAEVGDIGSGRFEDAQPQQAKHGHQSEVVAVRRFAASGEHRFELQMGEPQGR